MKRAVVLLSGGIDSNAILARLVRGLGEKVQAFTISFSEEEYDESDIARLMLDFAPEPARDAWQRGTSAEWICDVADAGRVRCMTFRDHRGPGLIFRMIPPQAISADHLGLTQEAGVQALCTQSDGLVLVTGPRASGNHITRLQAAVPFPSRARVPFGPSGAFTRS